MIVATPNRLKYITIQPLADLLNHKSFMVLMLLACSADRLTKLLKGAYQLNIKLPPFWRFEPDQLEYKDKERCLHALPDLLRFF